MVQFTDTKLTDTSPILKKCLMLLNFVSKKQVMCMLLNLGERALILHYPLPIYGNSFQCWQSFGSNFFYFVVNLYFIHFGKVLFTEKSVISGPFRLKKNIFEVLEFNRHLGINRHFVENCKNRGVC